MFEPYVRDAVVRELADVYIDPEAVMRARIGSLGGVTPDEALDAGREDDVLSWIERLKQGVAS